MTDAPASIWLSPVTALVLFVLGGALIIAIRPLWRSSGLGKPTEHRVGHQMANVRAAVTEWSNNGAGSGSGYVSADGELWRAVSGDALAAGDEVRVVGVDGLKLEVKKA